MISDLKIVQRQSGLFDISVSSEGLLETVDSLALKEQIIKLLVYSTWLKTIGYGVEIKSFRGIKYINLLSTVIGDRIARSVAFINYFYPDECKLGELKRFNINMSEGKLMIEITFGVFEIMIS